MGTVSKPSTLYKTFDEWATCFPEEAKKAKKLDIINKLCNQYGWQTYNASHKKEDVFYNIMKFSSEKIWKKSDNYNLIVKNNWLEKCLKSPYYTSTKKFWDGVFDTFAGYEQEVMQYSSVEEWQELSPKSYKIHHTKGWNSKVFLKLHEKTEQTRIKNLYTKEQIKEIILPLKKTSYGNSNNTKYNDWVIKKFKIKKISYCPEEIFYIENDEEMDMCAKLNGWKEEINEFVANYYKNLFTFYQCIKYTHKTYQDFYNRHDRYADYSNFERYQSHIVRIIEKCIEVNNWGDKWEKYWLGQDYDDYCQCIDKRNILQNYSLPFGPRMLDENTRSIINDFLIKTKNIKETDNINLKNLLNEADIIEEKIHTIQDNIRILESEQHGQMLKKIWD